MKARLLFRQREEFDDGAVLEAVLWEVPEPVPGSTHRFKYRLFYGYPGRPLVRYDNERGKGDHRHVGRIQAAYRFRTPEKLIEDFLADVAARRAL
ncbi:MAG: hypothetical protein HZC23_12275 [Rhodocyclales bacterium]|nr:hypothetical protein [Rhodocyclales bacterium]